MTRVSFSERIRERLLQYRIKRDFKVTPEPDGAEEPTELDQRFVVQFHRATHHHYDLRLEGDGVLASWAVPKGPTLDPDARRLAIRTEDHPLDYADFEGVIPSGEYGGGDVIVWDRGTYTLGGGHQELASAIDSGEIRFRLHGEKLSGRFLMLRRDRRGPRERWLLLHMDDSTAVRGWDPGDFPLSVKSGRTNDEVFEDPDDLWSRSSDSR